MPVETIQFENAGGEILSGRLDRPLEGAPLAYAIFAHCFTCSKQTRAVAAVSRALTQRGIAVLRFDFTGLGDSQGVFADTTFSSNVDDLVCAAAYLGDHYAAPEILVGHSFGGTACLKAAARLPGVKAVATIGSPFDPAHVRHLYRFMPVIAPAAKARPANWIGSNAVLKSSAPWMHNSAGA